jgi:hypothetical protein
MDEARRVLDRLDRVEALHHAGAPAVTLLDELRALVSEADDWLSAEGPGTEDAEGALDRCRMALADGSLTVSA